MSKYEKEKAEELRERIGEKSISADEWLSPR